ncbi:OsmC family protein [uncultured Mucilaginibacter sp.]|uniref:OsmC family protein n=1 Tax=uncultured Mucilaginibacter sp. TaxID=797541 RepID=UPI0025E71918|nr:OsmC family protein [uncultured Mucilaginibacter sp.]
MSITHNYLVNLNWKQGRMGGLTSPELTDEVDVATHPQFPQGMEHVWSPEHLFTAAVNSCLMTTFLSIAENSKLEFDDFSSQASGKLEMVDGKYLMSEVTLMPLLTILRAEDEEKALRVLQKSEAACLISNSVKSTIVFKPEIVVKAS